MIGIKIRRGGKTAMEDREVLKLVGLPPIEQDKRNFSYTFRRQGETEDRQVVGRITDYVITKKAVSITSPELINRNICVFCVVPGLTHTGGMVTWYMSAGGSDVPEFKSERDLTKIKMCSGRLVILAKAA